jgi:heme-degrading monooxygenase HmoA
MFAIIYEFEVKPGREAQLIASWSRVTDAIYAHRGSLGSRLHHAGGARYIAYAQWPSREVFERDVSLPPEFDEARAIMRDCCDSIITLRQLDVVADLLRAATRPAS